MWEIKPEYRDQLVWDFGYHKEEGEDDCTCMLCGCRIGVAEEDPLWDVHEEDCAGCLLCDIAVRIWIQHPERGTGGARFHPDCFGKIIRAWHETDGTVP